MFMEKSWILVFDSGTGGKYTAEQIREILPCENYLLYMDKTNCPYGNKSRHKLKKIVTNAIKKLTQLYNIKLIVIACNTISSVLGEYLKKIFYDIPFIFVLPTVKTQILQQPTLFLSTKNTAKHNKLLKKYKKYKNVWVYGFANLAKMIDESSGDYKKLQPYLSKKLKTFIYKKPVNVVLGCTHFNYIKEQIQFALKTKVNFYENSKKVALLVKENLIALGKINHKKNKGDWLVIFYI